ncbi:MAG: sporulation protein Cse60 [Gammaproteobacteria bacterium]|jgi:hypothetical protein|nr:sporulation protein Cse60 [Gammaproteobacteria bacterium]NNJ51036.1 sporulation protein Cse60 [Gammaproteobacteria bacterium]
MKVKIFDSQTSEHLEAEINQFLEDNPGINILDKLQSSQTQGENNHIRGLIVVSIWYE